MYSKKEIFRLFFLIYKIRQLRYHNRKRISDKELTSFADEINSNPSYLEDHEGKTISYQTIKRILRFNEVPRSITLEHINKLLKWFLENPLADIRNDHFPKLTHKREFSLFKNNYSKEHKKFFDTYAALSVIENDTTFYNFVTNKKNSITEKELRFKYKHPKISDQEKLIAYLEKLIHQLEDENLEAILKHDAYKEIKNYINHWGDRKVKKLLADMLEKKLHTASKELNKAIQLQKLLGSLGLLLFIVPKPGLFETTIIKEFEMKLQLDFDNNSQNHEDLLGSEEENTSEDSDF